MNIWFAANIPPQSNGGVARSMQGFSEGLRILGHQTTIVVNESSGGGGFLMFAAQLAKRLLLERNNPPDWIVARSTDGVGCALLSKAMGLKTRIALHNHGWEENVYETERRLPQELVYPQTSWKARIIRFPLLRACLSQCARCLCGTLSEIRWLKKKYPRYQGKLHYIPNGVQVSDKGFWMDRNDLPLNLLAVGGPTWKKNLRHTIAVFEELAPRWPQCRLFLVGTGLEKSCFPHPLPQEAVVVPDVQSSEMAQWYMTCPYIISSSRYEGGHSFALLEAMSYGCVVFASKIFSSMEIVRNNHNGVLITGVDVVDDVKVITAALKDKELLATMRRHAFTTANRNRWERQAKRLERVLCGQ
jgi:glycosyltransferase involved in cell wall biosynthesis